MFFVFFSGRLQGSRVEIPARPDFVAVRRRAFLLLVQLARARNETHAWTKQCVGAFLRRGFYLSVSLGVARRGIYCRVFGHVTIIMCRDHGMPNVKTEKTIFNREYFTIIFSYLVFSVHLIYFRLRPARSCSVI